MERELGFVSRSANPSEVVIAADLTKEKIGLKLESTFFFFLS